MENSDMLTDALHAALRDLPETEFTDQNGDPVDRKRLLITASTFGGCIRRRWGELHDVTPDNDADDPTGRFERGRVMEDWIVAKLKAGGAVITHAGDKQVTICDYDHGVGGTGDGVLGVDDGAALESMEIKSIDPRTAEHNLPREQHVKQVQLNIELARKMMGWNITAGRLFYVDASDWKKVYEYRIGRDTSAMAEAKARAKVLDKADKMEELLPEGQTTGECRYCQLKTACGAAKFRSYTSSGKGTVKIAALVNEAIQLADAIKGPQDELKKLKDQIKQEMQKNNSSMVQSDLGTAELAEVPGKRSLDWEAAEDAGLDVEPFTKVGKPSARLTVKGK